MPQPSVPVRDGRSAASGPLILGALAVLCVGAGLHAQEASESARFSLHMTSRSLSQVAEELSAQSNVPIIVHPDVVDRVVTVSIGNASLEEALTQLGMQSLCAWDYAHLLLPLDYGPDQRPPNWKEPASIPLDLPGGQTRLTEFAERISISSGALVCAAGEVADREVTVAGGNGLAVSQALDQLGETVLVRPGYCIVGLDRASLFARYGVLPLEVREAAVRDVVELLNKIRPKIIERVLRREQREFRKREDNDRRETLGRVAREMSQGIEVLNGLPKATRDEVREALQPYFETGMEIYQALPLEEQLEYTPVVEAMGKLKR
jgi:hypothetical protein